MPHHLVSKARYENGGTVIGVSGVYATLLPSRSVSVVPATSARAWPATPS
ncbi:MAG: hypothetical protein HN849_02880 [Victivallales bacterium]|nr:hypothetical protein [Victivallales bacterium]